MYQRRGVSAKMAWWKRNIVLIVVLAALEMPVWAAGNDSVLEHNQTVSTAWVNWTPSEWVRDESVKSLAEQLLTEAGSKEAVPRRIHDWVCENICYDWDALYAGIYSTLSPAQVLRERRGVCEAIANLTQTLFLEAGIPCIKVWGTALAEGERWSETELDTGCVNHTWNEFYMDGRWVTVDCTMDMKNSYADGAYSFAPWGNNYFDPSESFFAQTHQRLQRGFDLPENVPSDWAKPEIKAAVDREIVPLSFLTNYRTPVTECEFMELLGLDGGDDQPLKRIQAAVLLVQMLGGTSGASPPYEDVDLLNEEEQNALIVLYQAGIMVTWPMPA